MGLSWPRPSEVPSGPSNVQGDGQDRQGVPPTSPASPNKKKQGESSSSSSTTTSERDHPHNFSDIVAQGKDVPSAERLRELREQVSKGIYLAEKTKKYWVDKNTKANCFMLFAKGLSITWGSDQRYWSWRKPKPEEISNETDKEEADMIEVAELKDVCWLEIRGWLEMSHLNPGNTYDVAFVAKLAPNAYGWSVPVDLQLKVPNGAPPQHSRKENLWKMDGNKGWTDLKVGEVVVPAAGGLEGKMEIAMLRLGGDWKRGLILKGIKIIARSNK